MVRCMDDDICICQACDWGGNGCSGQAHRRKMLSAYTGCPSPADFTRMWSSVLEVPVENNGCGNAKNNLELPEGDGICQGVDAVDVSLNLNDYEMFNGLQQGQPRYNVNGEDLGMGCLTTMEKNSGTESSSHVTSSSGRQECIGLEWLPIGSSVNLAPAMNCMLMNPPPSTTCNKNNGLRLPTGQQAAHSLSNITTGDSSVADYQDCGLSPSLLNAAGDFEVSCSPQARDKAKMRYHEKKKTRTYDKSIHIYILHIFAPFKFTNNNLSSNQTALIPN
nr:putative zinc finger protein CONSTANS-LIKE 11 [Ipomoea batatas]